MTIPRGDFVGPRATGAARRRPPRALLGTLWFLVALVAAAPAAEWQWSVPMGEGRAFLWVPPACDRVRAVLVGQNNMLESGMLEHPAMRTTLAQLGIAEVFVAPPFDNVFRFDQGAGDCFNAMLRVLADESGYAELAAAPVIPIGHSACASYPWNFAAWNPGRTLAVLSIKGDAPLTPLTGSGKPNPDWGARTIAGIPGLMVMSEYEWWDDRLEPALAYRKAHPDTPIASFADVGHGHFDAMDSLVEFVALFIRKAAEARLPDARAAKDETALRPIDPRRGWLVERWRETELPRTPPGPAAEYQGDPAQAFWCFDGEMARATEAAYAAGRGKKRQQVDFVPAGALAAISSRHVGVELTFAPDTDGITFHLGAAFITPLPPRPRVAAKDRPPPVETVTPQPAADGTHAPGSVGISRITGPVLQVGPATFRLALNRAVRPGNPWSNDIWLLAHHDGNAEYKSAVQQGVIHLARHDTGLEQHLTFPRLPDRKWSREPIALRATSDAGLPVGFFVREGPAEVEGDTLQLTPIPVRAKLPVRITIVAWQSGRGGNPGIKAAPPVEQTFLVTP